MRHSDIIFVDFSVTLFDKFAFHLVIQFIQLKLYNDMKKMQNH